MATTRRLRYFSIDAHLLVDMMKAGIHHYEVIQDVLPPDSVLVRCAMDMFDMVNIVVESATFEEVPEGERPSEIRPRLFDLREGQPCRHFGDPGE